MANQTQETSQKESVVVWDQQGSSQDRRLWIQEESVSYLLTDIFVINGFRLTSFFSWIKKLKKISKATEALWFTAGEGSLGENDTKDNSLFQFNFSPEELELLKSANKRGLSWKVGDVSLKSMSPYFWFTSAWFSCYICQRYWFSDIYGFSIILEIYHMSDV